MSVFFLLHFKRLRTFCEACFFCGLRFCSDVTQLPSNCVLMAITHDIFIIWSRFALVGFFSFIIASVVALSAYAHAVALSCVCRQHVQLKHLEVLLPAHTAAGRAGRVGCRQPSDRDGRLSHLRVCIRRCD